MSLTPSKPSQIGDESRLHSFAACQGCVPFYYSLSTCKDVYSFCCPHVSILSTVSTHPRFTTPTFLSAGSLKPTPPSRENISGPSLLIATHPFIQAYPSSEGLDHPHSPPSIPLFLNPPPPSSQTPTAPKTPSLHLCDSAGNHRYPLSHLRLHLLYDELIVSQICFIRPHQTSNRSRLYSLVSARPSPVLHFLYFLLLIHSLNLSCELAVPSISLISPFIVVNVELEILFLL